MSGPSISDSPTLWERHLMALDDVTRRLERIASALHNANVPFAFVGGQAGLVTRDHLAGLPRDLEERLDHLLTDEGR